jgi:hypothetical protein
LFLINKIALTKIFIFLKKEVKSSKIQILFFFFYIYEKIEEVRTVEILKNQTDKKGNGNRRKESRKKETGTQHEEKQRQKGNKKGNGNKL